MDESQKRASLENPNHIVYDRKFDTAVRDTFYRSFLEKNKRYLELGNQKINRYDVHIEDVISEYYPEENILETPEHYGVFLESILINKYLFRDKSFLPVLVKKLNSLIHQCIEIQLRYNHMNNNLINRAQVLTSFLDWKDETTLPLELCNLLIISHYLNEMVSESQVMYNDKYKRIPVQEYRATMKLKCTYYIKEVKTRFFWSESLLYIVINNKIYRQPRSILLMYHNKICDLISVLSYSWYAKQSSLPTYAYTTTISFVKALIKLLLRFKNKAFSIFKVLEGLTIAEVLVTIERWKNDEFLWNLTKDLLEGVKFNYPGSELQGYLQDTDIPFRHELSCLSKILGLPLVSITGGSKSLYKKTNENLQIDMLKVRECICYFKKDYIKKHVQKYGRWPPCEPLPITAPDVLRKAQLYGKDPDCLDMRRQYGPVDIVFYEFVELTKNYEFNELENILPYLKDKTVSLLRSDVMAKWINGIQPEKSWEDTRLLLTYMLNPTMVHDHIGYLRKYCNTNNFSSLMDYLIIRVVPKEKELKIDFRGFGCKTFEDRHRSLVQEKNVSMYLDEFSDEQTLTSGELEILKKLNAFRRITNAYTAHHVLYIVIDASSWNNKFSSRAVDDFCAHTLDKVFDINIFSKTHKAFEHTLIYIPDQDDMFYWDGQRGGIEGLNQYTWMVAYIEQMKVAMKRFHLKYHLLCKGDDMRIVVLLPKAAYDVENLGIIKNQIVSNITEVCKGFGHSINIEESYGSAHYFAFSKAASIDSMEMPQVYRKIQKAYGANNAFINTLDDYVSSSFSNGHSASKVSPNILPCFAVSLLWFFWYLLNNPKYKSLTEAEMLAASLTPSNVGGLPIIYLHNFFVRAESDLFSPFLDIYSFCRINYNDVAKAMEGYLYLKPIIGNDYESLYSDPYTIPNARPGLPSGYLKSQIPNQLLRISRNEDIKQLIKLSQSKEQQAIVEVLNSNNHLRAKPLAMLYSALPSSVMKEVLAQFDSGKSVLDLLLLRRNKRYGNRLLMQVLKKEDELQQWRVDRLLGKIRGRSESVLHLITACPSESAFNIRRYLYGKPVYDITMPPLAHQLIMTNVNTYLGNRWCQENHFNYTLNFTNNTITSDGRYHYSDGMFNPFIGFTTRTGQINPSVHFIEKDITLKKVKILIDLCSWLNVSGINVTGEQIVSNVDVLIKAILKLYTDVDLDQLAPFAGKRKSGTAQHHMRSPGFRESIVPNTLSNIYTCFKGESSSHTRLQKSDKHYAINFLHCYCYALWIATAELDFKKVTTTNNYLWGITTPCEFCNIPIRELPLRFDEGLVNMISLPLLRVVKINRIATNILLKSLDQEGVKIANVREDNIELTYEHATLGLISYIMNKLYFDKLAIQNRHTDHVLTPEGHNILSIITGVSTGKEIGLTEIKSMDIRVMCDALLALVNYMLSHETKSSNPDVMKNWLLVTPIDGIPWRPLIGWINDAGRLSELVMRIHSETYIPPLGSYHSVIGVTRYLGYAAISSEGQHSPFNYLIYLSHYTMNNITGYLSMELNLIKNNHIRKMCPLKDIKVNTNAEDGQVLLAAASLIGRTLLWYEVYNLEDDIINEVGRRITDDKVDRIALIDPDYMSEESLQGVIGDIVDNDYESRPSIRRLKTLLLKYIDILEAPLDEFLERIIRITLDFYTRNHDNFFPRLNVVYASLSECIEVVRENRTQGHVINLDYDELRTRFEDLHMDDRQPYILPTFKNITFLKLHNSFVHRREISMHLEMDINVNNIIHTNSWVDSSYAWKILGHDNDSTTTLHFILSSYENIFPRHEYLACVLLYDGCGGFTNYLNRTCRNSILYFHTHPDEGVFRPAPNTALLNINRTNTIAYSYLDQGLYDLRYPEVIEELLKVYPKTDVLTSDLEMESTNIVYSISIWNGVLELQRQLMKTNGLSILRCSLENTRLVAIVVSLLRLRFIRCDLIRTKNESYCHGAYIVCHGFLENVNRPVDINDYYTIPCNDTLLLVNRFITRNNNALHQSFINSFGGSQRVCTIHLGINRGQFLYLGRLGITKLFLEFPPLTQDPVSILEKVTGYLGRDEGVTVDGLFDYCKLYKHDFYTRLVTWLRNDETVHYPRQAWDADTQAHRQHLLREIFKYEGYKITAQTSGNLVGGFKIDYNHLWDHFLRYFDQWKGRDIPNEAEPDICLKILTPTFENELIKSYVKGVHVCLSLANTLLAIDFGLSAAIMRGVNVADVYIDPQ